MVTGGAGFLGAHLSRRLVGLGHDVLAIDNLSSGDRSNVADLEGNARFELRELDVIEPVDFKADEIYHLACQASPTFYQRDPVYTTRTIVMGSLNLLEVAHRSDAKILLASTSEVYGDPTVTPQAESYRGNVDPTGPRACYDEGKRCAESLFFDYRRQFGTAVKVARIFNTYGPGMRVDDGRVVSTFISQALNGEPLTVYGDGSQTRSFCYVEDMVDGLVALMASDESVTGPINLGNPHEVRLLDLVDVVAKLVGGSVNVTHHPLPVDDPRRRCPDVTLAAHRLGWRAETPLEAGIARTIDWFRSRVDVSQDTRSL